ncbi:hypothetical protein QOZ96_003596 [Brevundimonas nasdae]|uniref:hypothetical protein n=1 Tax=Brevundimonas nasdae TaxID=172043 RepID=UPI0019113041|nr:hypothetical protein [Brevundimonas nasdae]MBK6024536.1 hypothetical protein [Brevundimonas nasdae]MDQ0453623.1 hypothetical protein [Brevundimonas nasdae]
MSILDGVAAEALEDFGDDFEDGMLTIPGGRVSDNQGGWINTNTAYHPCKVLLTDYSDYRRQALGIPATDRQVLVLGASLPSGIIPAAGHKITAPDPAKGLLSTTFNVIAKTGDPAAALYKLQAR